MLKPPLLLFALQGMAEDVFKEFHGSSGVSSSSGPISAQSSMILKNQTDATRANSIQMMVSITLQLLPKPRNLIRQRDCRMHGGFALELIDDWPRFF
jgi:hypothetical protein